MSVTRTSHDEFFYVYTCDVCEAVCKAFQAFAEMPNTMSASRVHEFKLLHDTCLLSERDTQPAPIIPL